MRSPARAVAAACYALLTRRGFDPGLTLGFYLHESRCGTRGSAVYTLNWGNIRIPTRRAAPWGRALNPKAKGSLAKYASWTDGLEAWCDLMSEVYVPSGRASLATAIPSYAPAGPPDFNQPQIYIAQVRTALESWIAEDQVMAGTRMLVIGDGTRVRNDHSLDGRILLKLSAGSAVVVDQVVDGTGLDAAPMQWARIVSPIEGYVALYLLRAVA
jgi:hypothetical protein